MNTTDTTADGRVAVIRGQAPLDRLGRLVHADDPAAQLALSLANLELALRAADLVPSQLTEVTVRTTDPMAVGAVLDTLSERFREMGAEPSTTVVGVDALPVHGQLVALDARAASDSQIRATTTTVMTETAKDTSMAVETTLDPTHPSPAAHVLRGLCGGNVHLPGDPGYDIARMPWNVALDQRPAAVALPRSVDDVRDVVRAAVAGGLRLAPQGTGHGAGPLVQGRLDDVVLVRTSAMAAVHVDPQARTARAEGGALWQDVVAAVAPHGLAALHGSSPDVAVAGYSLGGGLSWYARAHGLAANSVTAVELVTADGSFVRADTHQHADLFWALRGGGGSFGIVTAIEFRLYPIADVYAGMLLWPRERAPEVVRTWADWSGTAPDQVTTSLRVMSFPAIPELPDFLRGRQVVVVDGAVLADDAMAMSLLAPLRALDPELDTFARVPSASLTRLHMDPEGPTPAVGGGTVLASLPEEAVEAFLAEVGPGSTTSLLSAELRQLGGALGRPHPGAGALPLLDGAYAGYFVAMAPTPELAARGSADLQRLVTALAPWAGARPFLNFTEEATDTSRAYDPAAWERLLAVRRQVDPDERFVANHPVAARPRRG